MSEAPPYVPVLLSVIVSLSVYPPPLVVSVVEADPLAATTTVTLILFPVPPVPVITYVPAVLPAVFPALAAPSIADASPVGTATTANACVLVAATDASEG